MKSGQKTDSSAKKHLEKLNASPDTFLPQTKAHYQVSHVHKHILVPCDVLAAWKPYRLG